MIKRISPPRFRRVYWNVRFRPCATGVAVDIELALYPGKGTPKGPAFFNLLRASYLIPWAQINSWTWDNDLSVKPQHKKKHK